MHSFLFLLLSIFYITTSAQTPARWTEKEANDWYKKQPWLVGANYIPANAINELEMWQAETFDIKTIDKELGWAASIGMNTMRVFLHDLLWQQNPEGFKKRINQFLNIAEKHKIKPMIVLFDSVWDPKPQLGKQRDPKPGVHNSGWLQSPGADALQDSTQYPRLEAYVKGVVRAFANDSRILAWDVWNEPDNVMPQAEYKKLEPTNKVELVLTLLPKVYEWARSAKPKQPLTSGVWKGDWTTEAKMTPLERIQVNFSDIISFHSYDDGNKFEKRVESLQRYNRPILCTEYMARGNKSTFQNTMPIAKKYKVAAINWGLVAGKTQTNLPWDSWERPYIDRAPAVWFHEIFKPDGTPYDVNEVKFIKSIISK